MFVFYGRFLSINRANTMPIMMIATNRPAIAGTKYVSATDIGVEVVVVAVGTSTLKTTVLAVDDA